MSKIVKFHTWKEAEAALGHQTSGCYDCYHFGAVGCHPWRLFESDCAGGIFLEVETTKNTVLIAGQRCVLVKKDEGESLCHNCYLYNNDPGMNCREAAKQVGVLDLSMQGCKYKFIPHVIPSVAAMVPPEESASDKKYDQGKPMVGLMKRDFSRALLAVAAVTTYGVKKYNQPGSWKKVENAALRYEDALGRHDLAVANGKKVDMESGLLEKAHRAWNALATLELELMGMEDTAEVLNFLECRLEEDHGATE